MKSLTIVGALLVLFGIGGLIYGSVSYTSKEKVLDIGPIEATAEEKHTLPIPEIASIAALIAGVVMVAVSLKRA